MTDELDGFAKDLNHLSKIQDGDPKTLADDETKKSQEREAKMKVLDSQVDVLAQLLKAGLQPLFDQINTHYLQGKGQVDLEKESDDKSGSAVLGLKWDEHALFASMNTTYEDHLYITGAGENEESKLFIVEDRNFKDEAKKYLLELLSDPSRTSTHRTPPQIGMDRDGAN